MIYFIVQVAQTLNFKIFPITIYLSLYLRILVAYFILKIVNKEYVKTYVNVIYFFGCIATFFYFISILIPPVPDFIISNISPYFISPFDITNNIFNFSHNNTNILIFNFHGIIDSDFLGYSIPRNSGPYWEPGVNAGLSILALVSNFILTKKVISKKNLIFIINIITSFSTTGYFLLFIFIIFFPRTRIFIRIVSLPILLIALLFMYNTIEFLGTKISSQLQDIHMSSSGYSLVKVNRFGAFYVDVIDFLENPFFGKGRDYRSRIKGFSNTMDYSLVHRNNGVSNYLVSYGFIVFIFYFYLIKKSFMNLCISNNINKRFSWIILLMILIMGFSELYFRRPFFISFSLFFLIIQSNENEKIFKK